MREDETSAFWMNYDKDDLVQRVAVLHAQRRELAESLGAVEITGARKAVAQIFLKGEGIEVGAGDRPFPLPDGARCNYGDIRDRSALNQYFGNDRVSFTGHVDAQTYAGVPTASLDFVIAAHVIEHLHDPIGAIRGAVNTLKPGGIFVCVVPDMEKTWDRTRPPTTLEHLWIDSRDGGKSTLLQAYLEHFRYVHPVITGEHLPEDSAEVNARTNMEAGMDLHVHAWRAIDFTELLNAIAPSSNFAIEGHVPVVNENIYVLRRV
jgi:SAM-dependent methyltransferase